jgi:riboflavin biosynthesis pyrimidine reductase
MRQVFPASAAPLADADLATLYAYPARPVVRANMVSSVDGAATVSGRSGGLSSAADRHVFALLRTLADAILVGAATARAERYGPVRVRELWQHLRSGRSATPPIAVVTRRLDLDLALPLFASAPPHARTIVITTELAPQSLRDKAAQHADVIVAGRETVDLKSALDALADLGHRHVLVEGGPHLLGQLAAAELLDELCLTVSPLLAGPGAGRIVASPSLDLPSSPTRPLSLAHVLEDDGFLLSRYTTKTQ